VHGNGRFRSGVEREEEEAVIIALVVVIMLVIIKVKNLF